jgi:hypothetical protein
MRAFRRSSLLGLFSLELVLGFLTIRASADSKIDGEHEVIRKVANAEGAAEEGDHDPRSLRERGEREGRRQSDWIDYLQLAKIDGRWQIVHVLRELKPRLHLHAERINDERRPLQRTCKEARTENGETNSLEPRASGWRSRDQEIVGDPIGT